MTIPLFAPIAIVGQGCVLPGALSPSALWLLVRDGRCVLGPAPAGAWRLSPGRVLARGDDVVDRTWHDIGGTVEGFAQVFDPSGYALPASELAGLDPVVLWSLHAARDALAQARPATGRIGVILGNLSYPTPGLTRFAEQTWLGEVPTEDPRNRFSSGLPALLVARALDLDPSLSFCLDAACASSLYAIKLACDALHDWRADAVVAGGVNHVDDLFLHIGFSALQALSPSGRSRPFHRDADGLIPSTGAACILLKRLEDAVAAGDAILGVIRGVGLSNDGKSRGLLSPSVEGQRRAMEAAYAMAGLSPADISLIECHATGTRVGDAIELESMARVFGDAGARDVPIGSLKANLGHLITASGAAGLLKVLAAMATGVRPPTLNADPATDALADAPFRLLRAAEPWECEGVRRAAVNNFGFGGNNAHLLVEAVSTWAPDLIAPPSARPAEPIAVTAMSVLAADGAHVIDFTRALLSGRSALRPLDGGGHAAPADAITLDLAGLRTPPNDLAAALPQQLRVLQAVLQLEGALAGLDRERVAVLVGMQCDPEAARWGLRWRLPERVERASEADQDAIAPPLRAAGVLGTMPNIVANRLNAQLDLGGPSGTLSAEEASGVVALQLACRALRAGEVDAAIVGAVDLSCEPVHRRAASALLPPALLAAGDVAVALVLKPLSAATRDGDTLLALIDAPGASTTPGQAFGPGAIDLTATFGHAHAASGLLHVAAAIAACHHRVRLDGDGSPSPWLPGPGGRHARATTRGFGGDVRHVEVRVASGVGLPASGGVTHSAAAPAGGHPCLELFAADDLPALTARLRGQRAGGEGRVRGVVVSGSEEERQRRLRLLADHTADLDAPPPFAAVAEGVYLGAGEPGEVAFVFSGPAGAYQGMGRDLLLAMPELADRVAARFGDLDGAAGWLYASAPDSAPPPTAQLWASSALAQLHAELTRGVLAITPAASIGFCAGETNALFALGAWDDMDGLRADLEAAGVFDRELAGELRTLRRAWNLTADAPAAWVCWRAVAPVDDVRRALDGLDRVALTIVSSPTDVTFAGTPDACDAVVARLGRHRCRPLGYDTVMHCAEALPFDAAWRALHHRPTRPVPGVRFYTHATCTALPALDADTVADALTGQAMATVDFPRLITQAWDDGVRVFLEHGPHNACSHWIRSILGERQHLAVALDAPGHSSLHRAVDAAARLLAAGVALDHHALNARLARPAWPTTPPPARPLHFAAHWPHCTPPHAQAAPSGDRVEVLPPAPPMPPLMPLFDRAAAPVPAIVPVPAPVPAPVPVPCTPPQAPTSPPMSSHDPVLVLYRQVATAHHELLRLQADAHARFLALRQASVQALTRSPAAQGPPTPAPVPGLPAPPAPAPALAPPSRTTDAPGPLQGVLDRRALEVHASGRISTIFGDRFAQQDGFAVQVRMPEPPLLLADRITAIDAAPGVLGTGTLWSETDVTEDAWYLHEGRMPAGIAIEAGQADLLLISWMGVDFLNRGERVYRLLGCELAFHGRLPRPGETLRYAIHIDGHARQDAIRLFFFHYDCHAGDALRLSVRGGQAGFFTPAELAASGGILWDPASAAPLSPDAHHDAPTTVTPHTRLSRAQVQAFAAGRPWETFGEGFELTRPHTRTPRIAGGKMLLVDEVEAFEPTGGPWGRGYLRGRLALSPESWFFAGHFKNDPCMPGTLMFEGALQAMALFLAGVGATIDRDGWRFEPVPEERYTMRCRGQATPSSRVLSYEVFVSEVHEGPLPTLYADLLCTVDGLKAFHCARMGLRLVPDWPLGEAPVVDTHPQRVAEVDGFRFGLDSLLACALGKPSRGMGPAFELVADHRKVPRLPGPPYHFMSRLVDVGADAMSLRRGGHVVAEYDVPPDAWYFTDNAHPLMPLAVLMEVALQPCGWLASYIGCAATSPVDLFFRNLDGTLTLTAEVTPTTGTLQVHARLLSLSRASGMIIVSFEVEARTVEGVAIAAMNTVFGFFPAAALRAQAGLPIGHQAALLEAPSDVAIDLTTHPPRYVGPGARLAGGRLLMLDRITGFWPHRGDAGLGAARAEKDVHAGEWFFKAHFYSDPVQPGSLGIEALLQLLQFLMIARGLTDGLNRPHFQAAAIGHATRWTYRGQVRPESQRVTLTLELTSLEHEDDGVLAKATGSLHVDGLRIYQAHELAMRVVGGLAALRPASEQTTASEDPSAVATAWTWDPEVDRWLGDHRPTFTLPVVPMMCLADRVAQAAVAVRPGQVVVALEELTCHGWVLADRARRFHATATPTPGANDRLHVSLFAEPDVADAAPALIATAEVVLADRHSPRAPDLGPLASATPEPLPYATGAVFHGPAFQLLVALTASAEGASGRLDAAAGAVPTGLLHPALLDAALHVIPHDRLERWFGDAAAGSIGYPLYMDALTLHSPAPRAGEVHVEARPLEPLPNRRVRLAVELSSGGALFARLVLTEQLLPKGPLGAADGLERRAFLRDRRHIPGLSLSRSTPDGTRLELADVLASAWLPGTLPSVYGVEAADLTALATAIAQKEHAAHLLAVHPSQVSLTPDGAEATAPAFPLWRAPLATARAGNAIVVTSPAPPSLDLDPIRRFWNARVAMPPGWLGDDLYAALLRTYVRRIHLAHPDTLDALAGRGALFLANHQAQIESVLATTLLSALTGTNVVTMANAKHRTRWVGWLVHHLFAHPDCRDPDNIVYFEQRDPASFFDLVASLGDRVRAGGTSLLVHAAGTRQRSALEQTDRISSVLLDMAIDCDLPIVPLVFSGGLPLEPVERKLEFPTGHAAQDYTLGAPIWPADLQALPYAARREHVLNAINHLRPAGSAPNPPNAPRAQAIAAHQRDLGLGDVEATLLEALRALDAPGPDARLLLAALATGHLALQDDAHGRWLGAIGRRLLGASLAGLP